MKTNCYSKFKNFSLLSVMLSGSIFAAGNMNSTPNHNPLLKLDTLETYKLNEVSVTAKHRKTLSASKAFIR